MKSLMIAFVLSFSVMAMAAEPQTCIPSEKVNQVLQEFNIVTWSSTEAAWQPVRSIDLCQSDDALNSIVRSVLFMQAIPKATEGSLMTSIAMKEGPLHFFKARIKTIFVETEAHSRHCVAGGIVGYVDRNDDVPNAVHICPEGLKNYSTDIMTTYILLHEARHIDGFSHVLCAHGALGVSDNEAVTQGSCDDDYATQGSYGVGAAFLLDVYKTTEDPAQKQAARSNLVIDLMQRFNKLPLGLKQGVVTQSKTGIVSFFDGAKKFPLKMTSPDTVLAIRDDMPVFFGKDGSTKTYLFSPELSETEGSFAKQFRTVFSAADQNALVDIYFSSSEAGYSCFLLETKIHCGRGTEPEVDVALMAIKPVGFIRNETSNIVKGNSIYIAAADGYTYELPLNYEQLRRSTENDFVKSKRALNLTSLVQLSVKEELAVDKVGQLSSYSKTSHKWTVVPAYKGEVLKKVVSPFLWSSQLEEL